MSHRASMWARWQAVAARAARMQAHGLFWLLYYLCIVPMGLLRRLAADPLDRDRLRAPAWRARPDEPPADIARARRQS